MKPAKLTTLLIFVINFILASCSKDNAVTKSNDTAAVASTTKVSVRDVTPGLKVIAGNPIYGGNKDGVGANARFRQPSGIFVSSDNTLLIADYGNNSIRQIKQDSVVTTLKFPVVNDGPPGYVIQPLSVARVDSGKVSGTIAVVCPKDIFFYKPVELGGRQNVMSHYQAVIGKPFHVITNKYWYGGDFWLSVGGQITTNVAGLIQRGWWGMDGQSYFDNPNGDDIVGIAMAGFDPERVVYAATRNKLFKVQGFMSGYGTPGASSSVFSQFIFSSITGLACKKDGSKLYVVDNGNIFVINIGARPSSRVVLTGVNAFSVGVSNDDAYLYFTSQSRGIVSKYKL